MERGTKRIPIRIVLSSRNTGKQFPHKIVGPINYRALRFSSPRPAQEEMRLMNQELPAWQLDYKICEPFGSLLHLSFIGALALRKEGAMTTYAPEESIASPLPNRPHRCLILANAKAGSIRTLRDKVAAFGQRIWRTVSRRDESTECEPPDCIHLLAEAASRFGLEAHVEAIPAPHHIPERIRAAEAAADAP